MLSKMRLENCWIRIMKKIVKYEKLYTERSEAKNAEKLNRAQKCSILEPRYLGPAPLPLYPWLCHDFSTVLSASPAVFPFCDQLRHIKSWYGYSIFVLSMKLQWHAHLKDSHLLSQIDIVPHQCMPEALVMALRPVDSWDAHSNLKLPESDKHISFNYLL